MNRPQALLPFLFFSLALASCAATDPWRESQHREAEARAVELRTGTVYGTVSDSATGQPLVLAQVIALGTRSAMLSDERGRYELSRLEPGPIVLRVIPDRAELWRVERTETVSVIAQQRTHFDIRLPAWVASWADSDSIGTDVPGAARYLSCDLVLTKTRYQVGDRPQFVSHVYYSGPDSIFLAEANWGFNVSERRPRARLRLNGPSCNVSLVNDNLSVDPSGPHLDENDFYVLHDGEYIFGATSPQGDTLLTSRAMFPCAGTYRVEFHYQADLPTARAWIRSDPGSPRPSSRLEQILRRAPLVDLVATQIVQVDPR